MIMEKATELGMALSNSDEFRRLQAAKAAMDADKHVNELMEQYTQKQDKMVSMLENADSEGIYDPQNKARTAIPGRPAIYIE